MPCGNDEKEERYHEANHETRAFSPDAGPGPAAARLRKRRREWGAGGSDCLQHAGAAGGETAEFGGIYEVESPSQSPQESPVYQDPDAKLVRRAELYVETTEFDQAAQQLNEMVNQAGGYFESAAVEGGSYRNVNANRYGSYVIRVPEDAYTGFLQNAGELGYLASKTESTENISTQYYDTEARLKTLRTKQERLQALLAEAEVMEDIISLESALSDVEYEIEQYSSTMNQYDSLVSFSTIDLTLQEVTKVTEEPGETSSLEPKWRPASPPAWRGWWMASRAC